MAEMNACYDRDQNRDRPVQGAITGARLRRGGDEVVLRKDRGRRVDGFEELDFSVPDLDSLAFETVSANKLQAHAAREGLADERGNRRQATACGESCAP